MVIPCKVRERTPVVAHRAGQSGGEETWVETRWNKLNPELLGKRRLGEQREGPSRKETDGSFSWGCGLLKTTGPCLSLTARLMGWDLEARVSL